MVDNRCGLFEPTESYKWKRLQTVILFLAFSLLAIYANYAQVQKHDEQISIVDEWSYVDYIFQASQGNIVRPGENISLDSMEYLACHEIYGVGYIGSGCGKPQSNIDFPLEAKSPAEIHPPIYFVVTAQIAKYLSTYSSSLSLIDYARFIGVFWLIAGMAIWLFFLRILRTNIYVAFSIISLVSFSPLVTSVTSFISPDVTFALTSGVVFLGCLQWLRGKIPIWLLVFVGFFPVLFKVTHLLSVIIGVLFLLFFGIYGKRKTIKQVVSASVLLFSGALISLIGWQLIRALIRVSSSPLHPSNGQQPNVIKQLVFEFGFHVGSLPQFPESVLPVSQLSTFIVTIFGWLLIAAAFGGVMYLNKKQEEWMVATLATVSVLFGAILLSVVTLLLSGGALEATARYGLPFLLIWVLPLAIKLKSRIEVILIVLLAMGSWAALVY